MDESERVLDQLYDQKNQDGSLNHNELGVPDTNLDPQIRDMYEQASEHRKVLIHFYITYTYWFSVGVFVLIFTQAAVRVFTDRNDFQVLPQWTFNILISGMFVQFVGLLKIVTQNVWNFKSFFTHHNHLLKGAKDNKST